MKARIRRLVDLATATRPARAWRRYSGANGGLLAQGLAYQSLFAVFAAVWVSFAIAGLVVGAAPDLRTAVIHAIATAVPGLIDEGNGGAIEASVLLSARILGWTGAFAALSLVWTAIGWFDAARSGVRTMLDDPASRVNVALRKLADAGLAVGFGLAVLVSTGLSLATTTLGDAALRWLGIGEDGPAEAAARIAGAAAILIFDFGILLALYRVLAPARPPRAALLEGAAIAAVGVAALQVGGGALLGGAGSNPLLASFAVIVGLLVWFDLLCQVLLLAAAWMAETGADLRGRRGPAPMSEGPRRLGS